MTTLFLESSAALAVVKHESNRNDVLAEVRDADRMIASRLLRIECERSVLRYAILQPTQLPRIAEMKNELSILFSRVDFVEITKEICDHAGQLAPQALLRTLDAIHVATYFRLKKHHVGLRMLSFDARVLEAVGGVN